MTNAAAVTRGGHGGGVTRAAAGRQTGFVTTAARAADIPVAEIRRRAALDLTSLLVNYFDQLVGQFLTSKTRRGGHPVAEIRRRAACDWSSEKGVVINIVITTTTTTTTTTTIIMIFTDTYHVGGALVLTICSFAICHLDHLLF